MTSPTYETTQSDNSQRNILKLHIKEINIFPESIFARNHFLTKLCFSVQTGSDLQG